MRSLILRWTLGPLGRDGKSCAVAENRLLDTNILVYAYDVSEKRRREIAKALVDEVWDSGGGVVTLQNLSEFFFAGREMGTGWFLPGLEGLE